MYSSIYIYLSTLHHPSIIPSTRSTSSLNSSCINRTVKVKHTSNVLDRVVSITAVIVVTERVSIALGLDEVR